MTTRPPEPEFLTVRELAELLRMKERKVYDLAASGEVPCSRATGKLLFPRAEIRAWIAGQPGAGAAASRQPPPPIFLGSHDPLLDWAIRQSRCGLATFFDGSPRRARRGSRAARASAAGLHIHDAATGAWNVPAVAAASARPERRARRLRDARERGLVVRRGRLGAIAGLCRPAPAAASCRGSRESGTDTLFRHLLAEAGIGRDALDLAETARTEDEAVEAVATGAGGRDLRAEAPSPAPSGWASCRSSRSISTCSSTAAPGSSRRCRSSSPSAEAGPSATAPPPPGAMTSRIWAGALERLNARRRLTRGAIVSAPEPPAPSASPSGRRSSMSTAGLPDSGRRRSGREACAP